MEVIIDNDTGAVYIRREPTPPGVEPQRTTQFEKFGITLVWDGNGSLLGVEFAGNSRDFDDMPQVRYVGNDELERLKGATLRA